MITIPVLLIIVALVLFVLAAIGVAAGRINLTAAGLACLTLARLRGAATLAFALCTLTGCAWLEAHKSQIGQTAEVVGQRAFSIGLNVLMNSVANNTGDYNHSIAEGLRSEIPNIVTSADVARVVKIWGAPGAATATAATKLANVYSAAAPANQKQVAAVVEQIAEGLQNAASERNP